MVNLNFLPEEGYEFSWSEFNESYMMPSTLNYTVTEESILLNRAFRIRMIPHYWAHSFYYDTVFYENYLEKSLIHVLFCGKNLEPDPEHV